MGRDRVEKNIFGDEKVTKQPIVKNEETKIGRSYRYPPNYPRYSIIDGNIKKTERKWWKRWFNYDWLIDTIEKKPLMMVSMFVILVVLVIVIFSGLYFLASMGLLTFFGVFFSIGGIVVIVRKKAYLEDIEDTPPGRAQLTIEGRLAVWSGIVFLIIGIALLLIKILT